MKTLTLEIPDGDAAEIEATFDNVLEEMRRANEMMQQDQIEIDRLKIETRAIAEETRHVLAQLEAA
jgi:hypothetical protein